jgi:hypothetical protein
MMQTDARMTRHEPIVKEGRDMDTAAFDKASGVIASITSSVKPR